MEADLQYGYVTAARLRARYDRVSSMSRTVIKLVIVNVSEVSICCRNIDLFLFQNEINTAFTT